MYWSVMNECMMCVNAWCIYTVKPTWRHGTASALASLVSILLWGEDHLHRAESVLQNCVMGRCANLHIHVLLHLPFLLLHLLEEFRLNYTNEINQHKWLIIVAYFLNTFHCTNLISLRFLKCFSSPFPSFIKMLIGTHSHSTAKQWSNNSMSIDGYIYKEIILGMFV